MRVFISWSGPRASLVAKALAGWLPQCIQALSPWVSIDDVEKGSQWLNQIRDALREANGQAILCVTPENVDARWLIFEAGFLAAAGEHARLRVLLIGFEQGASLPMPLGSFNFTRAEKADFFKLMESLNAALQSPLTESVLEKSFEAYWPELEKAIHEGVALPAASPASTAKPDSSTQVLEVVAAVRRIEHLVAAMSDRILPREHQNSPEVIESRPYPGNLVSTGSPVQVVPPSGQRSRWGTVPSMGLSIAATQAATRHTDELLAAHQTLKEWQVNPPPWPAATPERARIDEWIDMIESELKTRGASVPGA